MKKLVLAFFALACISSANAQILQYGIKGGINQTTPNIDNLSIGNYKIFSDKSEIGYQFGAFARVKLLMLYVQPEFNYSVQRSRISIDNNGSISNNAKYQVNTFNVPILLGMKLGPLRVNAGPMYTKYIKANSTFKNFPDLKYDLNNSSWGYAAGIGVDLFKTLTADLRYEGAFETQSHIYTNDTRYKLGKPRNLSLTVGIFL